jgi:chromosome segregation ATPase
MPRSRFIVTIICLLILIGAIATAQSQNNEPQDLAAEVRALKAEMRQLQLEHQREKIARLERETRQTRADRRRIEARSGELDLELAEVDAQLSQNELTAENRQRLETVKAELAAGGLDSLHAERQTLEQREAELSRQLDEAQKRLRELLKTAGKP